LIRTLAPDLPKLLLDPIQINQMLVNLARNGIQSIASESGVVEVATQLLEPQEVLITVRDTGSGMPPNVLENVFNPFFTTKPDGTGLGLAICQHIVTDHGGRITVESQVGGGTVFSISLPLPRHQHAPVNGHLNKSLSNTFAKESLA
jgi:signal transduction histidine kinase